MSTTPSKLEARLRRVFGDDDPGSVGSGWMAGTASVFLGALAVLGVLAFSYPALLTTAEFRGALSGAGAAGAARGGDRRRVPARRHLADAAAPQSARADRARSGRSRPRWPAAATSRSATAPTCGLTIGVDWFVLNVLLTAMVFVPLERAFPLRDGQTTFRFGWATDGVHFLVSHLAVQTLSFLTLLPATSLAALWQPDGAAADGARRAAVGRSSSRSSLLVGSDAVLDPSRLPHRAGAVATPRRAPFERGDGLAGRVAPARRSTCSPRADSCWCRSSLLGFATAGALRVSRVRVVPRGVHPRQRALPLRLVRSRA